MTLSDRKAFFKAGIVFCGLCALLAAVASFKALPAYSMMEENTRRPPEFFQIFISRFTGVNYFAVHISIVIAVLYSLVGIILINFYFEQTHAPEILYIGFFTVSLSFEAARLILPLHFIYDIPSLYLLLVSRSLLFGRYFGLFSLFAASVYAAGLKEEKPRNTIMVIIIATLIIMIGVPIDTETWDTSLNMVNGYTSMFRLIEVVLFFITVISFLIAVNVRGSKEYAYIALGALCALLGRNILISADNWASPGLGFALLAVGTWFICTKLHKIYLWL
jgi:hypothetical protein